MTDELSKVGFFRELEVGSPDDPSLSASVRASAQPDEAQLARYLSGGAVLATTGQLVTDALSDDPAPVARLDIRTDGEWVWPDDLSYYVTRYHVELPAEFVSHAASRRWEPPLLSEQELEALSDRL